MASYWPYLGVTYALHLAVSAIVYVVVRRSAPAAWALGAMAVMLVLGSGGDDILWAFQSGTIGAVAGGLAAIVVAPRRPALAAGLLIAMATSGASLAFFVGTALHLLLTCPRALPWLAVPFGLYVAWFVAFGAAGTGSPSVIGLPAYVLSGPGHDGGPGSRGRRHPSSAWRSSWRWPSVSSWLDRSRRSSSHLWRRASRSSRSPGWCARSSGPTRPTPRATCTSRPQACSWPRPCCWPVSGDRSGDVIGAVLLVIALVGNVTLLVASHDRFLSKIVCEQALTPLARGSAGNPGGNPC